MEGDEYNQEDLDIHDKELSEYVIRVSTKDGLSTSMQYEI